MSITVRLAVRDWDYLTPLALGDIKPEKFTLELDRVQALPDDLAASDRYDAGEMSLSRYAQSRARGEDAILGVPHFLMRGFRHRCIITAKTSSLTTIADLAGKRIGVTGWQDSGNTWTRAILRREGIGIEDIRWYAGRLSEAHPIIDRLGAFARPGRIEAVPGERPMLDLLLEGGLDAIFTPFMPPGFFDPASPFRLLLPDLRRTEAAYFKAVGYVPGIHLLGVKWQMARDYPWLPQALSDILDQSAKVWMEKRIKYADTTPWLIDELCQVAQDLPTTWDKNGLAANEAMIAGFAEELHAQSLTDRVMSAKDMFPHF